MLLTWSGVEGGPRGKSHKLAVHRNFASFIERKDAVYSNVINLKCKDLALSLTKECVPYASMLCTMRDYAKGLEECRTKHLLLQFSKNYDESEDEKCNAESVDCVTDEEILPEVMFSWYMSYAAVWDKRKILEWGIENLNESELRFCYDSATERGKLDTVKYLHRKGLVLTKNCILQRGVEHNRVEIVQWYVDEKLPVREWACSYAVLTGHLHFWKTLHQNSFPWDYKTFLLSCSMTSSDEMRNYLWEKRCPIPPVREMLNFANGIGNTVAKHWIMDHCNFGNLFNRWNTVG